MTKKVTVPKEVAEAIEILRGKGLSNWSIMYQAEGAIFDYYPLILKRWAFDDDGAGSPDELMDALVNDYEVERTPHERLRDYYESLNEAEDTHERNGLSGAQYRQGWQCVRKTLDILGITVEGIND